MTRHEWLEHVRAYEQEPHAHEWQVHSGTATAYHVNFTVYCWCGAWATKWNGEICNVVEPTPETRTRQFEKQLLAAPQR